MFAIKRVYEPKAESDGFRVLVDRLWPRGLSKEKAGVDLWLKAIAPSDALRKSFHHDPGLWEDFEKKYVEELRANPEAVAQLREAAKGHKKTTLLYGAKDEIHNQAVVLKAFLAQK